MRIWIKPSSPNPFSLMAKGNQVPRPVGEGFRVRAKYPTPTLAGILISLIFLALFIRVQATSLQAESPTETAVPLVTATLAPTPTIASIPPINWSDVSLYKQDMKPGFEGDVDQAVNANRYIIFAQLTVNGDAII